MQIFFPSSSYLCNSPLQLFLASRSFLIQLVIQESKLFSSYGFIFASSPGERRNTFYLNALYQLQTSCPNGPDGSPKGKSWTMALQSQQY